MTDSCAAEPTNSTEPHEYCGSEKDRYEFKSFVPSEELAQPLKLLRVDDTQTGKRFVIVLQYVDYRPIQTPIMNGVIRFTQRKYAPLESKHIRLCTPKFYRNLENGDELDGAQNAEMSSYINTLLRESGTPVSEGSITASGLLVAHEEAWILCTSIKPSCRTDAKLLVAEFLDRGSDLIVSIIGDPSDFAMQLGIDVARHVASKCETKDSALHLLQRHMWWLAFGADKEIDAVVHVIHGPVHYEDKILPVKSSSEIARLKSLQIWFTKSTRFSNEQEYRFAVSAGCPVRNCISLGVSPELSQYIKSRDCGDGW